MYVSLLNQRVAVLPFVSFLGGFFVSASLWVYISSSSSLANSPFWAIAFVRRICQICHPVFTSLDFATIHFYRARSSALRPTPNLEELSLHLSLIYFSLFSTEPEVSDEREVNCLLVGTGCYLVLPELHDELSRVYCAHIYIYTDQIVCMWLQVINPVSELLSSGMWRRVILTYAAEEPATSVFWAGLLYPENAGSKFPEALVNISQKTVMFIITVLRRLDLIRLCIYEFQIYDNDISVLSVPSVCHGSARLHYTVLF
jgi:hypothetical protein